MSDNGSDDETSSGGEITDRDHLNASFCLFFPEADTNKNEDKQEPQQFPKEEIAMMESTQDVFAHLEKAATGTRTKQPRRRSSLLKQSMIKTFSESEERTVLKVLMEISKIEEKHYKAGFKEINFTAGVMNCFLVAYLFGAHPEHFWIIYLLESIYFIPRKYLNMIRAKPLNEALYYFDFCWMMNFNAIIALSLVVFPIPLPTAVRRFVSRGSFGIACGPMLGATAILPFVGFVFHDINTMTNVVIHAMPPMLLYTIRWHADEIKAAWPNVFHLESLQDSHFFPPDKGPFFLPGQGLGSIAGNAVLIYYLWFIPYTSWMLLMGMDLPRKNKPDGKPPVYDTVFHSFWRVGACQTFGRIFWKRPVETSRKQMEEDDYEVRDFLLYIGFHAIAATLSIPTLAFMCNYSKKLHVTLLLIVLLICVHRGSQRYTYYSTKMYSRMIRKEFLPGDSSGVKK